MLSALNRFRDGSQNGYIPIITCLSGIVIMVLVITLLFRPLKKFMFTYLLTDYHALNKS